MLWLSLMAAVCLPLGCSSQKKLRYLGPPGFPDVREHQLEIEYPDDVKNGDPLTVTMRPRTAADRSHDEIWDLSLVEAIHLALLNNRIVRTRNDFLSPGNSVLQNAQGVPSVFDPAIRETGFLFGNRGVESALSAFDPILSANVTTGHSEVVQNNPVLSGGIPAGRTLIQDTGQANLSITKNMAYGATAQVQQTWNYNDSNQPFQLFPSVYTGDVLFNYTQPLWAGAGTEFNRIAGPLSTNIQGVSGLNQGVVIARINTDISLTDFEAQVRNMVHDVEELYWELYLAYRNYDSLVTAREASKKIWQVVNSKAETGITGGGRAEEAQARENYFEARARAEAALGGPAGRGGEQGIYGLELQLRRVCGLPANDGRIIRPSDEPTLAKMVHNWDICLATAFARREELRKQRWNIKSIELQLKAANTLAHPQLNFVSSYQINGFGRRLFGDNLNNGSAGSQLQSMNRSLFAGDQTQWNVGLQFSVPLGYRNARAQVRNTELQLMKAYAVLDTQETEIGHELASAFQGIEYWYQNAQTNYNRREAAAENLAAVEADYQADRKSLDLLLQSQTRMTIADIAFYRSVTEYNKALAELQMRQGTLLEYNNIHLSEREWVPEARVDAERRAWARAYALDASEFDSVHHEPAPVAPLRQPVMPAPHYDAPPEMPLPVVNPTEGMPDSVEILESPPRAARIATRDATQVPVK